MREDTLRIQSGQAEDFQNVLQTRLKMCIIALKAQTAHAGVQLDVDLHCPARTHRGSGVCLGNGKIRHRLRHIVFQNPLRLIGGCKAQHQDRERNAAAAQLLALVDVGHSQIVHADPLQMLRHMDRSVSVCVRFGNAEQLHARPHLTADDVQIVRKIVKIDLRPCPFQCTLHLSSLLSSYIE